MSRPLLAAISLIAVTMPFAASAQGWGGDYDRQWGEGYGQRFSGYPQFQGEKAHIRAEIRQGLNEGRLDWNEARGLYRQLEQVQRSEAHEFGEHGWALPYEDQREIRSKLDRIDRSVDDARDFGGYED